MFNLLAFLSSLASYLLLLAIITIMGSIGIIIGISLRKKKDAAEGKRDGK